MSKILNKVGPSTVQLGSEVEVQPTLDSGAYTTFRNMFGRHIKSFNMNTDKLLFIKSKPMQEINEDISAFLTPEMKQRFADFSLMYRRNYMLYGPPGTGKSALLNIIADEFVKKHNGIVFRDFEPREIGEYANHLRAVDRKFNPEAPERPIMLVCEEFDDRLYQDEYSYTNLLDGEFTFPNSVLVATTNYFTKIPSRIKNRPSRFAMIREIGYPDKEARLSFLNNLVPENYKSVIDIDAVAEKTTNVSIDHLKDVVISICCFGQTYDEAVAKIREMQLHDDDDSEDD